MRHHNSPNSAFYAELLVSIHHDMVGAILPQNEIERDTEEIRKRARQEGMSFLTKTLPALGKSIDVSLSTGNALKFRGFKTAHGTALPAFMRGVFGALFRADGVPWFATWYSDMCLGRDIMDLDTVDNPYGLRSSERIDEETNSDLWAYAREGTEKFFDLDGKTFPGLAHLYEVYRGREHVADAISLGVRPSRMVPHDQTVVLNRRREAMVVALKSLRQVCYCFYKLNIPYTHEQKAHVLADFVNVDASLDFKRSELTWRENRILKDARNLISRVLCNADPLAGRPRHGPGAVATGEKSPEKHHFKRYYEDLNKVFPYDEWFFYNSSHLCDSLQELQAMEHLKAGTAKVVLVPKDSRGPRLISCEPLEYQWVQQSLMGVLVDAIEGHPLTKGRVNFARQSVNRDLAMKGSSPPFRWSTLDMKEASDRVSLELVKELFPMRWFEALAASRSPQTRLPDGTIVPLKKFAPMGSAVCFPVEALIFWALCTAAIKYDTLRSDLPGEGSTNCFVYGDDIICDAAYHGVIINTLPAFGLELNHGKCCTAGPFKESCGMDSFFGCSVTPTRIRSVWCEDPKSGAFISYVAYANAFYRDGLLETARVIRIMVQDTLRYYGWHDVPTVSRGETSQTAFVRPDVHARNYNSPRNIRVNRKLQRLEVRSYAYKPRTERTSTEGWSLLTRLHAPSETTKQPEELLTPLVANTLPTGQYAIVHRNKLMRTWTPLV